MPVFRGVPVAVNCPKVYISMKPDLVYFYDSSTFPIGDNKVLVAIIISISVNG